MHKSSIVSWEHQHYSYNQFSNESVQYFDSNSSYSGSSERSVFLLQVKHVWKNLACFWFCLANNTFPGCLDLLCQLFFWTDKEFLESSQKSSQSPSSWLKIHLSLVKYFQTYKKKKKKNLLYWEGRDQPSCLLKWGEDSDVWFTPASEILLAGSNPDSSLAFPCCALLGPGHILSHCT